MAEIYDNIETKFEDGLRKIITGANVKRVDFCVGYFNLRGWKRIVNEIDDLEGEFVTEINEESRRPEQKHRKCRLLVGMLSTPRDLLKLFYSGEDWLPDTETVQRAKLRLALEFREQLLLGYPSKDDEMALRRLSGQMKDGRVTVKLYAKDNLHAKLYLAYRPDDNFNKIVGIMGSSNLTYPGLNKQGELNAQFLDSDHVGKLAKWFDDRWNEKFCLDITNELIQVIDNSWAANRILSPYYIYLKVAYHLSEDARNGIKEFALTPEFQYDLFDFQQNAVKMVVHHLQNEKRHGAMIGDVVGLGKTITACAVAKIYETTFSSSTLIVCPANLQEMWRKYVVKYDLKADVMSVAKSIDIDNARFYRLIIVDESHNLRNGGVRYTNIKNLVERQSSHVLLLTATPYNKHYNDLAMQLRLFLSDDQDLGLRPERLIEKMGSERAFARQYPDVLIRSIGAFMKSDHVEDWNELMKLFLVRRTRSFIKEHYAKTDETNGRKYLQYPDGRRSYFPDRIPKSLKFQTTAGDQFSRLYSDEMMDLMNALELPRYGLSNYINPKEAEKAPEGIKRVLDGLSAAGSQMMGFCRSTFFKRMDSSGFSFLLSIYRHILRNCVYIYAIENKLDLPLSDKNALPEDYREDQDADASGPFTENDENGLTLNIPTDLRIYMDRAQDYLNIIAGKPNIKWVKYSYFKPSLKKQLYADCENLIKMIKLCGAWEQEKDQKLNLLCDMLNGEHKNDKVVVFTQYADTARYIYNQLRKRGFTAIDYATGNSENPTAKVVKFSPKSNDKKLDSAEQTRILIATDVLSEGQNLQDAHIVVNYDLPWAIIRLIQRCGRVDRIGQESEKIWCYSFFPADGVEEIIHLRGRLSERINQNAQAIGSDEVFFEGNEQNLRDMYNEEAGILDEDEGDDVDLASYAFQIWSDATKKHPELKRIIPDLQNMVYSTRKAAPTEKDGVITYARTADDYDVLTWMDAKGELQTQSQYRILKALECPYGCEGIEPLPCHHEIVTKSMEIIKRQTESTAPTVVGNRLGTRFRILNVLEDFNRKESDLFHTDERKAEVELAINDLYNNQLQTNAKFNLGRMLKRGMDYDEVVDYVLELRKNGQLCVIREDEASERDNVIICSMGIKHEN